MPSHSLDDAGGKTVHNDGVADFRMHGKYLALFGIAASEDGDCGYMEI
jgi:hypothetical protein